MRVQPVLISEDMRGTAARHHEEDNRVANQCALRNTALEWVSAALHEVRLRNLAAMATSRMEQHEYAASHFSAIVRLNDRDSVFEPRSEASGQIGGHRLPRLKATRELYKRVVWAQRETTMEDWHEREALRKRAKEEQYHWRIGEGRWLIESRGYSIHLYEE